MYTPFKIYFSPVRIPRFVVKYNSEFQNIHYNTNHLIVTIRINDIFTLFYIVKYKINSNNNNY